MAASFCTRNKFACPQVFLQFGLNFCDVDSGVLESSVNSITAVSLQKGVRHYIATTAGVLKQGYQDCLKQDAVQGQQGADVP